MPQNPAEIAHGPMLIGTFINVALWGVCVVQVYLYQRSCCRDSTWVKIFIYLLFLADTLHTLFLIIFMYHALVYNFGNFQSLTTADWLAASSPAITGITGGAVQIFFVRRLKILTRNWILVTVVSACATTTILAGIAAAAAVHFVPQYQDFHQFKVVVIIMLVSSSIADVLIAASMTLHLKSQKTGFKKTNSCIDKIVRMAIQTGTVTSAWAITDLVLFLVSPLGWHLIFIFSLSKLYSNSLMSTLNARDVWKFEFYSETIDIENIPGLVTTQGDVTQLSTLPRNDHGTPEVFVHVEQTTSQTSDDHSKESPQEDRSYEAAA